MPTGFKSLCKMLIRWARSNVRESVMMNDFMFKKFRSTPLLGRRINHVLQWLDMSVVQLMIVGMVACLFWRPGVYGVQVLLASAISACVPAAFYALRHRNSNGLWAFAYNLFWVVALSWITPYSILTVHRDGWLTRTIRQTTPPAISIKTPGRSDAEDAGAARRGRPAPSGRASLPHHRSVTQDQRPARTRVIKGGRPSYTWLERRCDCSSLW